MAEQGGIPRGPDAFEHLLVCAKLCEREAQAVRSVVLGMTAQEAAPLMGVSASTVGSYRQRAYAKLGLPCKADFLRLPAVRAWQEAMRAEEGEQTWQPP
ncbi:MAG: sigma factor-like helix-turn-helix DNA-binding protein [Coriobacteriia bacterium]|nr:sigma factor-like helix-turn-helix DNA-binding protein [Coriobacteriia bacterium]